MVRVTDARTGELKRWESSSGKPLAIVKGGKLTLTDLGKRQGYTIIDNHLEQRRK